MKKIAIHNRKGSFSEHWITYCIQNNIPHKVVNCYDDDIIAQMEDCGALMWHHHHANPKDVLFAKQLLNALEQSGIVVFPNFRTGWHFDDKLGQKYLFEAAHIPSIPSHAFYSKQDALKWAGETDYPKVFKLRGGAGASNVKLVKSRQEAEKYIERAFGKGFSQYNAWSGLKERLRKYREGDTDFKDVLKGVARLVYQTEFSKISGNEKGYIYFQDFVPDNTFDIRVIVVKDKAYGLKRHTRENDFRASGSKKYSYEPLDTAILEIAFKTSETLGLQCVAFDFIYLDGKPVIIEVSYGFGTEGSGKCPGYWDRNYNYYEGKFNSFGWMVDLVINEIKN